MSATENTESIVPENTKPLDQNQDKKPKEPIEGASNELKDTTMIMMNTGSPFRHSTYLNRNFQSPQQQATPLRNYRERNSNLLGGGSYMSQERRNLEISNSPFRNFSFDARETNEEQVCDVSMGLRQKRNNKNINNSIQNTPIHDLIGNHNKAKEEDDNQISNYQSERMHSPYSNFLKYRTNYGTEHTAQFQGRSPLVFRAAGSSSILRKGNSPSLDKVVNRTNHTSLNFCEPNKEIDQSYSSPCLQSSNRKATTGEMTPLSIQNKSPIKIDEQQYYDNKIAYQSNPLQWENQQFYYLPINSQIPMPFYNNSMHQNILHESQVQSQLQLQQQFQFQQQQQQQQQQFQQYEVEHKKDNTKICIYRSDSSTIIQAGSGQIQNESFIKYNRQQSVSSTKKSSFSSTGKKTKRQRPSNPQHKNDTIQVQNPNMPFRVPIYKFVKSSPYSSTEQRFSGSNYDNQSDPLCYRNNSHNQPSMTLPSLRKQPTFGAQAPQYFQNIAQHNYGNKLHRNPHCYSQYDHHHSRNESQNQLQQQFSSSAYFKELSPPLQLQRQILQRRKQPKRYGDHQLNKSSYNQQNHHHPKQMQNPCEQIVDIYYTLDKPQQHSSGKKSQGTDKENNAMISNMNGNNNNTFSQQNDGDTFKPCSCSKSKCLKKYCECFSAGRRCRKECNCCGCMNNLQFQTKRQEALQKQKDGGKIQKIGEIQGKIQHLKGCTCKKSNCIKNYCECFQNNIPCGDSCKCVCCKNTLQERMLRRQSSVNTSNFKQYKLQQQQYFDSMQEDIGYSRNNNSLHNVDMLDGAQRGNFCEIIRQEQDINLMNPHQDKQGKYTFGNISAQQSSNTSPVIKKPSQQVQVSKNNYSVESRASIQRAGIKSSGILGKKDTMSHECTEFTPSPFKKMQNEWSSIKKKPSNNGSRNQKQIRHQDGFEDEEEEQSEEQLGYAEEQQQNDEQQNDGQDDGDKKQEEKQKSKKTMDQLKLVGSTRNVPSDKNSCENKNLLIKKKKVSTNNSSNNNKNFQLALSKGNKNVQNKRNVNKSLFDQKELMDNIENSIINTDIKKNKKRLKRTVNLIQKVQDEGLEQTKKPQLRKKSERISQKQVKVQ